jgi:hypothetical protein
MSVFCCCQPVPGGWPPVPVLLLLLCSVNLCCYGMGISCVAASEYYRVAAYFPPPHLHPRRNALALLFCQSLSCLCYSLVAANPTYAPAAALLVLT